MATPVSNSVSTPAIDQANGTLTDEFINGLVQGSSWTFGGGPHVITYSFTLDGPAVIPGASTNPWTPTLENAFTHALSTWSDVANITVQQHPRDTTNSTLFTQAGADIAATLTGNDLQLLFSAVGLGAEDR